MSTASSSGDASTTRPDDFPQLTRSQRSRLVKSARKLTMILGEYPMPQVNLPSPISSQKKYRKGGAATLCGPILSMTKKLARVALEPLQTVYRRDSDIEWEETASSKSQPTDLSHGIGWSPVLLLRTGSRPESEIANDGHASYVSTPTEVPSPAGSSFRKRTSSLLSISTSKSFLPSILDWEKRKEEREIRQRRQRLAKLARFLGERVPPDLVMPKPGSVNSRRGSPRGRFYPPLTPPVTPVVPPPIHAESPTSQQGTPLSPSPPSPLGEDPRPAVEKIVMSEPMPFSPDPAPPYPFTEEHCRSHSSSLVRELPMQPSIDGYFEPGEHLDAMSMTLEDEKESENHSSITPPPRSESRLGFLRLRSAASSPEPRAVSHRREHRQGWSGEWNVGNMQDVISKLREL